MIEKKEKIEQRVILDPISPPFREQEQFKFLFEYKDFWYGEHLDLVHILINVYSTRYLIKYFYTDVLRERKINENKLSYRDSDFIANEIDDTLKKLEKYIIGDLKKFKEKKLKRRIKNE